MIWLPWWNLFLAPHWSQDKVQKRHQISGGLLSSCSPMLSCDTGSLALPRALQMLPPPGLSALPLDQHTPAVLPSRRNFTNFGAGDLSKLATLPGFSFFLLFNTQMHACSKHWNNAIPHCPPRANTRDPTTQIPTIPAIFFTEHTVGVSLPFSFWVLVVLWFCLFCFLEDIYFQYFIILIP